VTTTPNAPAERLLAFAAALGRTAGCETTSEFGRRVRSNEGGADHGAASTLMVCAGGSKAGHGDASKLANLDDGNVIARFEDYYATIAEHWFWVF